MAIIKWLHVSDLHLNIDGVENRRLRKKLIEYLQNRHHGLVPLQYEHSQNRIKIY